MLGAHFRLRFTYNSLTVESAEFNVKPHNMFVHVQPSNGQYGAGATKADIGAGITVYARDGGNNLLTGADNTNAGSDYVTVTVLEADGTVVGREPAGYEAAVSERGREELRATWDCKATLAPTSGCASRTTR